MHWGRRPTTRNILGEFFYRFCDVAVFGEKKDRHGGKDHESDNVTAHGSSVSIFICSESSPAGRGQMVKTRR